jgi:hypothetical protein
MNLRAVRLPARLGCALRCMGSKLYSTGLQKEMGGLTKRIQTVTKPPKESSIRDADAASAIKDMESFINQLSKAAKAKK